MKINLNINIIDFLKNNKIISSRGITYLSNQLVRSADIKTVYDLLSYTAESEKTLSKLRGISKKSELALNETLNNYDSRLYLGMPQEEIDELNEQIEEEQSIVSEQIEEEQSIVSEKIEDKIDLNTNIIELFKNNKTISARGITYLTNQLIRSANIKTVYDLLSYTAENEKILSKLPGISRNSKLILNDVLKEYDSRLYIGMSMDEIDKVKIDDEIVVKNIISNIINDYFMLDESINSRMDKFLFHEYDIESVYCLIYFITKNGIINYSDNREYISILSSQFKYYDSRLYLGMPLEWIEDIFFEYKYKKYMFEKLMKEALRKKQNSSITDFDKREIEYKVSCMYNKIIDYKNIEKNPELKAK